MRWQAGAIALFTASIVVAGLAAPRAEAAADFSKDEAAVAKKIEDTYGVKVLRIRSGEIDGSPVYIVTVMNPAGDYNAAFQVSTLAIDKASGDLVSQFRQTPTGQQRSGADIRNPPTDDSGVELRRQTERRLRQR